MPRPRSAALCGGLGLHRRTPPLSTPSLSPDPLSQFAPSALLDLSLCLLGHGRGLAAHTGSAAVAVAVAGLPLQSLLSLAVVAWFVGLGFGNPPIVHFP